MQDITQQIQPEDIDTSKHFFEAFDKREREISARWIVCFCQDRGEGWESFTYQDIDGFYRSKGVRDGFWMNQLDRYGIVPDDSDAKNPKYAISDEFISRCYIASPKK